MNWLQMLRLSVLTSLPKSPESNADVPRTNYPQFKPSQIGSCSISNSISSSISNSLSYFRFARCVSVSLFTSRMWVCL